MKRGIGELKDDPRNLNSQLEPCIRQLNAADKNYTKAVEEKKTVQSENLCFGAKAFLIPQGFIGP